MGGDLRLTDEDVLALPALEDAQRDTSPARATLDRANALLDAGKTREAADLCLAALRGGPLSPMTAANLVMVLRAAGDVTEAEIIADDLLAQLAAGLTDTPTDAHRRINLGRLMAVLGRKDAAAKVLAQALHHNPTHQNGVLTLTGILLHKGQADAAMALWNPIFAADPANGVIRLHLVRILAQSGFLGHARTLLNTAEPLCTANRAEFDHVAGALRGTLAGPAQAAMTLEVFERFAPSYDKTLAKLGNLGPDAVATMLHQVGLASTTQAARAGCGLRHRAVWHTAASLCATGCTGLICRPRCWPRRARKKLMMHCHGPIWPRLARCRMDRLI